MGEADELLFVTEGDNAVPVLEPDSARGLEARRGKAHELVEENAVVRVASAFWHELKATLARHLCGIMIPHAGAINSGSARLGRIAHVRRERLIVANRREADIQTGVGRLQLGGFRPYSCRKATLALVPFETFVAAPTDDPLLDPLPP